MAGAGGGAPRCTVGLVGGMGPVTARPPKGGEKKFARPWAISAWFGSWRSPMRPSATRAQRSDSIAPRAAIATVGPNSVVDTGDNRSEGLSRIDARVAPDSA